MLATVAKPKKPGRPPKYGDTGDGGRSGKRLSIDIDPQVREGIDRFIAFWYTEHRVRMEVTQVVQKALIEMFEKSGLWPPPQQPQN
jgi:hypothetical protein